MGHVAACHLLLLVRVGDMDKDARRVWQACRASGRELVGEWGRGSLRGADAWWSWFPCLQVDRDVAGRRDGVDGLGIRAWRLGSPLIDTWELLTVTRGGSAERGKAGLCLGL